jgi:hypothetical protein
MGPAASNCASNRPRRTPPADPGLAAGWEDVSAAQTGCRCAQADTAGTRSTTSKTVEVARLPWVRIPSLPPLTSANANRRLGLSRAEPASSNRSSNRRRRRPGSRRRGWSGAAPARRGGWSSRSPVTPTGSPACAPGVPTPERRPGGWVPTSRPAGGRRGPHAAGRPLRQARRGRHLQAGSHRRRPGACRLHFSEANFTRFSNLA